jgi:tetratricopeptide (TPR) repeat protein
MGSKMEHDEETKIPEYLEEFLRESEQPEEIYELDKKTRREIKISLWMFSKIINFFVKFKYLLITPLMMPTNIFRKSFALLFWIFIIMIPMFVFGSLFIGFIALLFIIKSIKHIRLKNILHPIKCFKGFRLKRILNPLLTFFKSMIDYLAFKFIRSIASQYYNGTITFEKAQTRTTNLLKKTLFRNWSEINMINYLRLYLSSIPILIYFCCYLLHDKLASVELQFELHLIWIESAILSGLTKDAEIVIKKYLTTYENKTYYDQWIELSHYFAFLLIQHGHSIEAIDYLDHAIEFYSIEENIKELSSPLIDAYGLRGIANRNTGALKESINDFSKAMDLIMTPPYGEDNSDADDFHNIWAFGRNAYNLAITYHDKGDYKNALKYYKIVLDQQKEIIHSPFSLISDIANTFKAFAVDLFEKNVIFSTSRHIDHTDVEAHANGNIGLILINQNYFDAAIKYLKMALNISDQNADLHGQRLWNYYLGVAYEEKEDFENAYGYYKKSVDLLELLRHEYKSKNFFTAFDLLERGFRNRYFWRWDTSNTSWASIERLAEIPKIPCTRSPYKTFDNEE